MLAIFAYAIGIMYTPGPINLLGLHSGLNQKTRRHLGFFAGVGCAMFILFVALAYVGLQLVNPRLLPFISLIGCSYILYIAWKVSVSSVDINRRESNAGALSFKEGLFMQLLNPKALVATLPISTIQFPAAGVDGVAVLFWSLLLSVLAFGAPASYSVAGMLLGHRLQSPRYFRLFNSAMAILLVYVALTIGYEHVYLPWVI